MTVFTGIVHVHSTHSYDGKVSLPALKALLKARGHTFACMTEHTDTMTPGSAEQFVRECRALSDTSFVFVPGFEVPYENAHVLHIGASEYITAIADAQALKRWRSVTPLVILAHPVRNDFVVDNELLSCLDGVEIWNQQYEGKGMPRTRSIALLDTLRQQKPLLATGGVDLHREEHLGAPVTKLQLPDLTEVAIVAALQAGQYTVCSEQVSFGGADHVSLSTTQKLQSRTAIVIIAAGKTTNALLAKIGIRLPRGLVRTIRGRV